MMLHKTFGEVHKLVAANQPLLLVGEKGSGKTTLAKQVVEDLNLPFFSLSLTRQTTLSHLLGFLSVNGTYVPSLLRNAFEHGGGMLLDEIDAGDANVLLGLNTIENGYIAFPDGIVERHKDFRLIATANPQDEHSHYVGRSKLDAATLDRFDTIHVDRDDDLEQELVDFETLEHIRLIRKILKENNSSVVISMRDALRFQLRKDLDLLEGHVYKLFGKNDYYYEEYKSKATNFSKFKDQSECKTFEDLGTLLKSRIPVSK